MNVILRVLSLQLIFTLSMTYLQAKSFADEVDSAKSSANEENDALLKKLSEPRISNLYFRGSFLIYDCKARHFVCVNDESSSECKSRRESAQKQKLQNLECMPIKEFSSYEFCSKEIDRIVAQNQKLNFCELKF